MPEGTRTGPAAGWARPVLALGLLALLSACGQQQATQPTTHAAASHSGYYNRPASYDPPGPPGDPWGPYIRDAARRFDVPERWVREVMRQESGGRVSATSPVGAMGLMQVMPGTYRELQSRYGLGDDPYHPYDSIMAGTAYIREMYDLYGSPAFLAAYNAGPRRLEDYLWNSRGLPNETRNYVARIGPNIVAHHPARRAAPEIYAAAEIPLSIPAGPRRMAPATILALREQRQAVDPGIQVATLPPGPVVRMDPIPDGSTSPAPVQLASLDGVVRMEPIPDRSPGPAALPEPPPALTLAPPRAAPPRAGRPAATSPARASALTAVLPPPRAADVLAANNAQAGRQPPRGFGLMGTAQASTLNLGSSGLGMPMPASLRGPARPAPQPAAPQPASTQPAAGGWAVQVGAFASQNLARGAASAARETAGGASRIQVQPVPGGRSTLYRARVTGLSQPAAQQMCERLRRNGACLVLSPEGQS